MIQRIGHVGRDTLHALESIGRSFLFLLRILRSAPKRAHHWYQIIEQMRILGVNSLVIIGIAAMFIGMVVALQGFYTLDRFGASAQLGQLIALSVFRELGPVMTALLFAGRAGSSLASELGIMQATDQISSMEVMAVSPYASILFPRVIATLLVVPCLVLVFNMLAIYGGYVIAVLWLGLDPGTFWSNMQSSVDFSVDVIGGFEKSFYFAMLIAWIAVDRGYHAIPNAGGIGRAATQTVVMASVAILAADLALTSGML